MADKTSRSLFLQQLGRIAKEVLGLALLILQLLEHLFKLLR